jgi:hypothetical protein
MFLLLQHLPLFVLGTRSSLKIPIAMGTNQAINFCFGLIALISMLSPMQPVLP